MVIAVVPSSMVVWNRFRCSVLLEGISGAGVPLSWLAQYHDGMACHAMKA